MRWFAALALLGWPQFCDRRVLVEAGPLYERYDGVFCGMLTCHDVHEVFQRPNGAQYVKETTDCVPFAFTRACP